MAPSAAFVLVLLLATGLAADAAAPIDWSPVKAAIDAFAAYPSLGVIVGNASGVLYTYAKGGFNLTAPLLVASSSKWLSAAVIARVVEQTAGTPSPFRFSSKPTEYVPQWAASVNASDPRSNITLAMLLSFTDGMDTMPCSDGDNASSFTFDTCMNLIANEFSPFVGRSLPFPPNTTFFYSGVHLHVAGCMAARAAGSTSNNPWPALFQDQFRSVFGLTTSDAFFLPVGNPLIAGGLGISPRDYGRWLLDYFKGTYLDPETVRRMETDWTGDGIAIGSSPVGEAWHYGYGHWLECRLNSTSTLGDGEPGVCVNASACTSPPTLVWRPACANSCEHSSLGKFGFYPYIDRCFGQTSHVTQGYWAIAAMASGDTATSIVLGNSLWPAVRQAFLSQLREAGPGDDDGSGSDGSGSDGSGSDGSGGTAVTPLLLPKLVTLLLVVLSLTIGAV